MMFFVVLISFFSFRYFRIRLLLTYYNHNSLSLYFSLIVTYLEFFYSSNFRWEEAYQLLEEMKMNRVSNAHQVIASMIKGEYDDESNWQMVEYFFDKYNSEGCGYGLRLYNAIMEALWWFRQKERAARVLSEATRRGLFPELYRKSKLVWSLDVHR